MWRFFPIPSLSVPLLFMLRVPLPSFCSLVAVQLPRFFTLPCGPHQHLTWTCSPSDAPVPKSHLLLSEALGPASKALAVFFPIVRAETIKHLVSKKELMIRKPGPFLLYSLWDSCVQACQWSSRSSQKGCGWFTVLWDREESFWTEGVAGNPQLPQLLPFHAHVKWPVLEVGSSDPTYLIRPPDLNLNIFKISIICIYFLYFYFVFIWSVVYFIRNTVMFSHFS